MRIKIINKGCRTAMDDTSAVLTLTHFQPCRGINFLTMRILVRLSRCHGAIEAIEHRRAGERSIEN